MQTSARRPGLIAIAMVALLAAIVGGGGVALASHDFNDVSDANPFHDQIDAIATAGITTGFDDGGYHPSAAVSRQAMAAFMARGFGRAGYDTDSTNNPADGAQTNGAVAVITAGAEGTGTGGYVVVNGTAQMATAVTDCQCTLAAEVRDATDGVNGSTRTSLSDDVNVITLNIHNVAVTGRFAIEAGESHAYTVRFRATTAGGNTAITVSTDITATYVPFDQSGNGA